MDKGLYYKKLKQLILIFVFGLFSGCIYFNFLWRLQGALFQNEWGMIFDRVLMYSLTDIYNSLQNYTVWILVFHVTICILGITKIGKVFLEGIVISIGFLIGAEETLLLLGFDMKEGGLFFAKIIAVMFVYVLVLGVTFVLACSMSSLKWTSRTKSRKWKSIQLKKYLISVFVTLVSHVVYIFACSYVNLQKISFENFIP